MWNIGFTISILYNIGNLQRQTDAFMMRTEIEAMNPKFHIKVIGVDWKTYMTDMAHSRLPMFFTGWSADFPDAHDFVFPFYHSNGTLACWQGYSDSYMDSWIDAAARTTDPTVKQLMYHYIQWRAHDLCPSVPITEPIGRHFERDWVVGWYYNELYCGSHSSGLGSTEPESHRIYFGNLLKWYYVPHALLDSTSPPISNYLPFDVQYDGKVDIKDVSAVARCFGVAYGPPIDTRWNFRCDINNDREIDIKDISLIARDFAKNSPIWTPTL